MTSDTLPPEARFIGCMLGAAIGDALGMPFAESLPAAEVRIFQPSAMTPVVVPVALLGTPDREEPLGAGQWTDDTQLMLRLAETLVDEQGLFVPESWAHMLVRWLNEAPRGPGLSTLQAALELRTGDLDWDEAADPEGAGCGAATRVAPIGLWAAADPARRRTAAVQQAQTTHGHPDAQAAALAMAEAVALAATRPSQHLGVEFLDEVTQATAQYDPRFATFSECASLARNLLEDSADPQAALRILGVSAWSREAVPAALYIAARWSDDPEAALIRAVNAGGGADALGCMVGAVLGALHGPDALPVEWRRGVEDGARIVSLASQLYSVAARGSE